MEESKDKPLLTLNPVQDTTTQSTTNNNASTPSSATTTTNIPELKPLQFKKFPYNGKEPNLLGKFMIIGYDSKFVEKMSSTIYDEYVSMPNSTTPIEVKMDDMPMIINEISYDYNQEFLDDDIMLEVLFPNKPIVYFIKSPNVKNTVFPQTNIVFSLNPYDDANSKKSLNGYGYQFYDIEKYQNSVICFPKVFCFLSEYPYFSAYHNLCTKIYKMFKNNSVSFPIEGFIYNIITFLPSPLKYGIDLSVWKVADTQDDKRKGPGTQPVESPKKSSLQAKQLKMDNTISFPQLSGYPLFNFNLPMLFNILPVDIIMQVFFVTFLENDIIFYSSNLEILNIVLYIFSNFNYPCNDSIYFWHIVSVSQESFMNSSSTFVGKTCSCMIGINAPYDPKVKTTLRVKEHFVLDIDNKYFTYVSDTNSPESKRIASLLDTLPKILKSQTPNANEQGEIIDALRTLNMTLTNFSKKFNLMTASNNPKEQSTANIEFFKYDDMIAKHNKSIQEAFYVFFLNVFKYYHSSFKVGCDNNNDTNDNNNDAKRESVMTQFGSENKFIRSSTKNNNSIYIEYQVEKETLNEFERDFHLKFKETSKFGAYIINFMLYYDTIDLFKIPLLFTEEFINISKFNEVEKGFRVTNYLDIIDQLYYPQTPEEVFKISSAKGIKATIKDINFNEFYTFSDKHLRSDFLRHGMFSEYFEKLVVGGVVRPCYKKCELDTKYLLEYVYIMNNLTKEEVKEIFPMKTLLEENEVITCKLDTISDIVEQTLITQKSFDKLEFIVYAIFNVFAATRGLCKVEDSMLEILLLTDLSNKTQFNLRKYLTKIISIYARFALKAVNEGNNTQSACFTYCYRILTKYLQNNEIIPNEELMSLLNLDFIIKTENNTTINYNTKGSEDPSLVGIMHRNHELKPHFEYVNVDQSFLDKIKEEKECNLWTLSDNLGFDGLISQPEQEDKGKQLRDSLASKDTKKGIVIQCSVEGRTDIQPLNIYYYSPKKLFNESNKLLYKYFDKLDNAALDRNHLMQLLWNLIYYIYLIEKVSVDKQISFPCEISKAFLTIYQGLVMKSE